MIRRFRHRGLRLLFEGDASRVAPELRARVERALDLLHFSRAPRDMDLPGYRLHALRGDLQGFWSITLSGNWRIIFRFEDGEAWDVDLVDYH